MGAVAEMLVAVVVVADVVAVVAVVRVAVAVVGEGSVLLILLLGVGAGALWIRKQQKHKKTGFFPSMRLCMLREGMHSKTHSQFLSNF